MPKPERRSMSQLPPPPSVAPVQVSKEQERTILSYPPDDAQLPAGQLEREPASKQAGSHKRLEPKVALTTRIPQTLKTRLVRIARYNDLEMETIVLRALERELELDIYEKPAKWGREE